MNLGDSGNMPIPFYPVNQNGFSEIQDGISDMVPSFDPDYED